MFSALLFFIGIVFVKTDSENLTNFAVRLNNSFANSSKEGRLEFYYSGRWGTVCGDYFTDESARVACASLRFGYIGTVIGNRHGAGTGTIWLDDVNCIGTETGIEQCVHNPWGVHNCDHRQDVSIICECGTGIFHRPTGKISSSNFPLPYGNRQDCKNYIRVTSGHAVIIAFLAFRTKPDSDWVTITCESGNDFRSPRYSGFIFPAILTISSCNLVNVYFHSDYGNTYTGFSLTYEITSDNVIGGFTTKPSNAFPRSDADEAVIFNCATVNRYFPWWTISGKLFEKIERNYTITNSTCGVITSVPYSSWFMAETLRPGSCNLIVVAPGNELDRLAGSLVCTDSTLSSERAILAPIDLKLRSSKGMNSLAVVTGKIGEEGMNISCNPSFNVYYFRYYYQPEPSLVFTNRLYSGGPVVRVRILRIYWTSEGNVVSSIYSSNTSSYILVKRSKDGLIPSYTCNIVCDLFSNNISDIIEISFSTETEVSYKAYQNLKHQVLILGVLLGVAVLTTIIVIVVIAISCNFRHRKGNTATEVVQKLDDNEHELRQKEGEGNRYEVDFENETEYGNLEPSHRCLPAKPVFYEELELKK